MSSYVFNKYCSDRLLSTEIAEFKDIAEASNYAMSLLSRESDLFFDKIRFYRENPNRVHRVVYIAQKSIELNEGV